MFAVLLQIVHERRNDSFEMLDKGVVVPCVWDEAVVFESLIGKVGWMSTGLHIVGKHVRLPCLDIRIVLVCEIVVLNANLLCQPCCKRFEAASMYSVELQVAFKFLVKYNLPDKGHTESMSVFVHAESAL